MHKIKIDYLSALSLDQPFAHMICHLKMNVESRSWTTKRRGTIAIHATAKASKQEFEWVNEQFGLNLKPGDVDFASVIGLADVVDVITEGEVTRKTSKWFIGPYGFVLDNIVLLPRSVPTKGNRKILEIKRKAARTNAEPAHSNPVSAAAPICVEQVPALIGRNPLLPHHSDVNRDNLIFLAFKKLRGFMTPKLFGMGKLRQRVYALTLPWGSITNFFDEPSLKAA